MPSQKSSLTISRSDAKKYVAKSTLKQDIYHVTTKTNATKIKQIGFKKSKKDYGNFWGSGIYACLDKKSMNWYKKNTLTPDKQEVLVMKADIRNPIIFDASHINDSDSGARAIAWQINMKKEFDFLLRKFSNTNAKDPIAKALTKIAKDSGHDSIIIKDSGKFRLTIGGNQIVIFDSRKLKIIENKTNRST
jgi:hypothetical protein